MSDRAATQRQALRSVPLTDLRTGMVPPGMPFVEAGGALNQVSFRFLLMLWASASENRTRIEAIEARLAAAGIP